MKQKNRAGKLREDMPFLLGTPPPASSQKSAKVMRSIKTKNTGPEISIRKRLWAEGIRGYRSNPKTIPGRPDICFIGKKIAIFINGCFWHRCPTCSPALPKTNMDFWQKKFERNIIRDKLKSSRLKNAGWRVLTLWECEIKQDAAGCVTKVKALFFNNDRLQ